MLPCPAVGATPNPLLRAPTGQKPAGAASMAIGCLGIVAVCGGIGYGALQYLPLPPGGDPTVTRIFAVLVGCLGGLGLSSVWSLVFGHGRGGGTRGPLHARARSDAPPEDGQPIIATGVVRADRPLTSPLGGVACAAYDYRMFRRTGTGSKTNEVPVYWGYVGTAVHHRLAVAQLPRRSAPACTPRRRRRWVATPPWRARGSTSDRPAGRRWSTACSARSTPSASGSRTTR